MIGPLDVTRDRPVIWRILPESQMRAAPMIVPAVGREEVSEMCPVEDDEVIEAFATDCADHTFRVRIL